MRPVADIEARWHRLFDDSVGVDLRQAVRDESGFDPCDDGLRSVCWKAFLLNGPLSKVSWTKKLKESRSAYTSLHDHFLKYIDRPDDLHSAVDPLAEDNKSPWDTFRQDELIREEIWKDVVRCNIDNYFFQEPTTQKSLLDILFIYSKLNPDTGYRQGMHEILAPVLWVVHQDSLNTSLVSSSIKNKPDADFMLDVLDATYTDHDSFNIFCAVMQTAKTFYEIGETRDSSAIIAESERIQKDLLGIVAHDLAKHLEVIGIVPQIYIIRWLRLLFGREFAFKDTLKLWDMLFAENLAIEVVEWCCVAILLRLRWELINADYTVAITRLTRLQLPLEGDSARDLVRDALRMLREKTAETGARIVESRTGRGYHISSSAEETSLSSLTSGASQRTHRRIQSQSQSSPGKSPARAGASQRFTTPQRQLEGLFSNVASNLQKQSEGLSVSSVTKVLRDAASEVRKNVESLQTQHSRGVSHDIARPAISSITAPNLASQQLEEQLRKLEERNQALARMLEDAQTSLRKWKVDTSASDASREDTFNTALARIQFVSVYLQESDIPIPPMSPVHERKEPLLSQAGPSNPPDRTDHSSDGSSVNVPKPPQTPAEDQALLQAETTQAVRTAHVEEPTLSPPHSNMSTYTAASSASIPVDSTPSSIPPPRPSLADSSFSYMLGETAHNTKLSFYRAKPPPEERRSEERRLSVSGGVGGVKGREDSDLVKKKGSKREKVVLIGSERRGSKVQGADSALPLKNLGPS